MLPGAAILSVIAHYKVPNCVKYEVQSMHRESIRWTKRKQATGGCPGYLMRSVGEVFDRRNCEARASPEMGHQVVEPPGRQPRGWNVQ